jgi:regulator of protease activity HflC (stomatin/prohibitin superfamily)
MKTSIVRILMCVSFMVLASGCARVKPDEVGVRTVNFGNGKGIVSRDFGPGYHRFLWPLDTWHQFPSTIQMIKFEKDATNGGAPSQGPGEALEITSTDGDHVMMTAEVLYRISDGEAHRVLQEIGAEDRCREFVRGLAQDAMRVLFGRLQTEAFYDEASREAVRQEALSQLRDRIKPRGIEVVDLLVQSLEFDQNYENLIKQKKLADQRVELEKAKSRAAEEKGKVSKILAETAVKVSTIEKETEAEITRKTAELNFQAGMLKGEADKYATTLTADAGLYKSQKDAEGQKLLKEAEADGIEHMNKALAGEGGRNYIAREAAKNLNMSGVAFPSSGYEWFNPREMAQKLGATETKDEKK